ncbi:MAG: transposase [Candidatus Moraniibacteriota bacterium]
MKKMSLPSRKELIKKVKDRYLESTRAEKVKILDELCANTGMHRKYLTERLSAKVDLDYVNPINRKRKEYYGMEAIYYLKKVWRIFDYPCGQNLEPMMREYIRVLEHCKEISFPRGVKQKLLKISSSTIDRRLKKSKGELKRKILSSTKPGSLQGKIPISTSCWNEKRLGFGELDTVAHCGNSASGEFVCSLTYTDILSQWTESIAVMGKAEKRIIKGLDDIKGRLPFDLLGIDPDNGGEFINWQLFNYCRAREIEFTRGRPYKKNDNAHIEQKNYTHVRKLIGYQRLEEDHHLKKLNDLYCQEWRLYKNFFIPNKKLVSKKRMGTKIVKKFDKPRTPFQRLLEDKNYPEKKKEALRAIYSQLNPAELRRNIDKKLSKI